MGLFSSIFGTQSATKTTIPSWLKPGLQSYSGDISHYLSSDPQQYVAPATGLQNLAFGNAANLGNEQQALTGALGAVQAAGSAPAASAGPAAQSAITQANPAAQATAATYNAPTLGKATQAQSANIAPVSTINGSSLLDNLPAYMDPATQALVNSTMADYNQTAAQQRAAQQAQQAGNGDWGSGGQFYMSNFDIQNALKGANLENQLRSQAFTQAINAANLDASRRQDASAFNAGASNTRAGQQGGLDMQRNLFNADAANQFKVHGADLAAQAGQFNAGQQNQVGMFNAGQSNDLGMFNTGQANSVGMFNTGQTNQQSQANAGLANDQLNRALQAAGMQGDIANSMGSNARGDVALQGTLGDMQHSIAQAQASALPNQLLQAGQMFNPLMGLTGQTKTDTPSLYNTALSLGSLFASDRRLKTNIEKTGEYPDGLGKYQWNWKADPKGEKIRGVIADEVRQLRPWAYVENFRDGYAGVNYGAL